MACRICRSLNPYFKKFDEMMGYSIGWCAKKRTFVWVDVVPCEHFKPLA